ncbi:heme-dependent oxidative N-demethylase family protein [Salipiger mucosus]|uniref:DUF3445 domain-containing protein n=1 Tax=Salipiger mucosus DSM 16094 TaxID=1123237 RepID=S9RTP5_9RHOB|nr:DUF3445 domain-containing protein [Salipiger mucosus]EPX81450.1 hypothetical protein Salmuc_05116 [Salipiger mucosus DSM 16094]
MILQTRLPYDPASQRPLPNIAPLEMAEWLMVDEAYAPQMAERARLLAEDRAAVLALDPAARPAAEELLEMVLAHLPEGFTREGEAVTRPDGVVVTLDRADPMGTLGHLVQEDLCLMEKRGEEHVLTGAVLCFPAHWRLADKFMQPLVAIHVPIAAYDDNIARRVQRLFDGIRPGRPLWRFNLLNDEDPALFQPGRKAAPRQETPARYLRSERQCLVRLPESGAVVFSIHTFVLERAAVMEATA